MVKEQTTAETETGTIPRHPLAIAWDAWLATKEGKEARAANTLPHNTNHYLENRLKRAFDAGAKAAQTAGWQHTHERDAELIQRDGMMCEAHPGLEFGHDPECAGPGMAWLVEGRKQIESLASPSDTEQLIRLREAVELAEQRLADNERWWHLASGSNTPTAFEKQAYEARARVTKETLDVLREALQVKAKMEGIDHK